MPRLWPCSQAGRALVRRVNPKWVAVGINIVFWTLVVVLAVFLARYG